jgi:hypothetical protein
MLCFKEMIMKTRFIIIGIIIALLSLLTGCASNAAKDTPAPDTQSPSTQNPVQNTAQEQNLADQMAQYNPQLSDLFRRHLSNGKMSGTLSITLYIEASGVVAAADVEPQSGSFSPEFLKAAQTMLKGWRFQTKQQAVFSYTMTLTQ